MVGGWYLLGAALWLGALKESEGITVLMLASVLGMTTLATALVGWGAAVETKDNKCVTALITVFLTWA